MDYSDNLLKYSIKKFSSEKKCTHVRRGVALVTLLLSLGGGHQKMGQALGGVMEKWDTSCVKKNCSRLWRSHQIEHISGESQRELLRKFCSRLRRSHKIKWTHQIIQSLWGKLDANCYKIAIF